MRERRADSRPRPRRQTFWLSAGIAALALAFDAVGGFVLWQEHEDARLQAQTEIANVANAVARDIARNVEVIDLALEAVRDNLHHDKLFSLGLGLSHSLLFQRAAVAKKLGAVIVTDADGNIVLDSFALFPRQGNIVNRPFFTAQKADPHRGLFISLPTVSNLNSLWYICLSRAILTADGKFDGIVFGSLKLDYFDQLFAQIDLGKAGTLALVRADGHLMFRRPFKVEELGADLSPSALMVNARRAPSGHFTTISQLDKVERIYAYTTLPGSDMLLSVGRSVDEVYAPWRKRARSIILIFAGVNLAMFAMALVLRRAFRRQQAASDEAQRNAALFSGALDGSPIGTALMELHGRATHVNPALCEMLGYSPSELLQSDLANLTHDDTRQADEIWINRMLNGEITSYATEWLLHTKSGATLWTLRSVSLVRDGNGRPLYFIGHVQDITARKVAEKALYEEKERLRITLVAITDGVIVTDARGQIVFANPVAEVILGRHVATLAGQPAGTAIALLDEATLAPRPDIAAACLGPNGTEQHRSGGVIRDPAGTLRFVEASAAPVRTPGGESLGSVVVLRDVTESRDLQQRLMYNASHDSLTGLPNRTAFEAALDAAIAEVRGTATTHALAFLDLDRFKIINDSAGHAAGDALLKAVAELLRSQLRATDMVGRLGGDEFGVLLHNCALDDARRVLEQVVHATEAMRFDWGGHRYSVGVSIGLTDIVDDATNRSTLLTQADVACYAAKNSGRNRVNVYRDEQSEAMDYHRKILVAAGIRQAIDEDRFALFAQRIATTRPSEEQRYEILTRMRDSNGNTISPGLFIPAAERYDLMASIDRWVLRRLMIDYGEALARVPHLNVHVNLSANSLNDPHLLDFIESLFAASPLAPKTITFEITETALVRNAESAAHVIGRLRAQGSEVALDDFGIGLSSFSYLRSFPVDVVKIDGGFVVNMSRNTVDRNIVNSIHRIATELGARTVAESVESETTLEEVRAIGITYAQGYAIHRPAPLEDVIATDMHITDPSTDGNGKPDVGPLDA
ncbi:EAL domain-containing protein [Chitinasiproducens palmae]|uniref:PAS domain S-box-containing protein/diguanylate cyclase (GGDEF) domain-containing protein n=1 Tax=Chitinasiproducens palmae TaxID=1770053 RepID=A0A1H2PIK4_9BURK|nr:EAL domain-containing protein [Chitinasiproducens palmae]SDV46079.1 PAS domain S-box-containing protein/diguanylate cyclase (GGDEF) domain-containing protein [Chitinasiproducens palmae]